MKKIEIPDFLFQKLCLQYDTKTVERILQGYSVKRKTTFRVNTLKANREEVQEVLQQQGISYQQMPWYEDAFLLEEATEKEIKGLPIYEEGKIYLQSLSSMIPAIVLEAKEKENILDMCAAPRWKNNSNGNDI